MKVTPKPGAIVNTDEGRGTVVENNLLTGFLKIRLDSRPDTTPKVCHRRDVKILRDAQIKIEREEIEAFKGIE